MWLRRSLVLVLAVALVAGCDESASKTYSAQEVADALRAHGFADAGVSSDPAAFPQIRPKARQGPSRLVAAVDPSLKYRTHVNGASIGDVIVAALIFDTQAEASCGEPNVIGTCLRKQNVVVLVRGSREQAARETLDDLN